MSKVIVGILATKTQRYAQHQPHLPQKFLVQGKKYAVPGYIPEKLAHRIVELDGGELIYEEVEESAPPETEPAQAPQGKKTEVNPESKEGDGSKTNPDSKEVKPQTKEGKRKPGQTK